MQEFLVFLFVLFTIVITIGALAQAYLKLPWMFTIVITGLVFSNLHIFGSIEQNSTYKLFSQLGMLFLLFLIGLKIDVNEIRRMLAQIFLGNLFSWFLEAFVLSLFFYLVLPNMFSNSYLICLIVGLGFATIGEVILVAVLTEFKLIKTKFGQLTLGMGVTDDIMEIIVLALVTTLPYFYIIDESSTLASTNGVLSIWVFLALSFIIILSLTYFSHLIGKKTKVLLPQIAHSSFPFVNNFFFLWIFLGMLLISGIFLEEMMIIGAIFAGIMCQNLFPEKMFHKFEMKYQFLMIFVSPFFFFNIGYKIDLALINFSNIGWIVSIILISVTTRVISSVILFRKQLGFNESIIFGFGLCAKFSTSVIVLSLLVDFGYITPSAYSFLMITFLIMKILVVFIYSIGTSKIRMATINTEYKNPSLQTG